MSWPTGITHSCGQEVHAHHHEGTLYFFRCPCGVSGPWVDLAKQKGKWKRPSTSGWQKRK